ncbi:CDP-alcohol phosphatidyltransferase family protein [Streptomyces sp. NPDC051133]|uniref:CDP-alcohol phosphatidyltransferase family protein n=1 Tax=Streptomyces sp. NPDC051133 TaxID=3155521 RepID=UPI003431C25C
MDFSNALSQLSTVQKPARGISVYSRFVNRPAGRLLAATAHRIGLSPNQVTAASALITMVAIMAIALHPPSYATGRWVALALLLGYALDSADGQLARLNGSVSMRGEWVDHVTDCAKLLALHTAVLITLYRFHDLPSPALLFIPITFQFASVVFFFAGILTEQLKKQQAGVRILPVRPPCTIRAIAMLPVDYGVLCLTFLFLGNWMVFFVLYIALLAAHVVLIPAFLAKWCRELS